MSACAAIWGVVLLASRVPVGVSAFMFRAPGGACAGAAPCSRSSGLSRCAAGLPCVSGGLRRAHRIEYEDGEKLSGWIQNRIIQKFESGYEPRLFFEIKLSTVNLDTAGNHSKLNVDTAGNHSTLKLDSAGNHSQPNVDSAGHQRSAKSDFMHKLMQNWTF